MNAAEIVDERRETAEEGAVLLHLTEKAAREVRKILEEKQLPPTTGLVVAVRGGGCSGMSYVLGFEHDSEPRPRQELESRGVRVLVDETAIPYIQGLEIDFVDDLLNRGFKFQNPNATATCGCGTSFTV